jgi:hypothetical protein
MSEVVKETTKKQKGGYRSIQGAGPGRPKGLQNKFTSLKDSFLKAFEKTGGTEGLIEFINESKRNRALFYGWITKMLPSNMDHSGEIKTDGKLIIEIVQTK